MRRQQAFTIIELLMAIALVAIVLSLAIPSFQDMIVVHRLKSVTQQVVTDLQLARSEAVSRNALMRLEFGSNSSVSCYTIYTIVSSSARCDCRLGAGAACSSLPAANEVRTASVDQSLSVQIQIPADVDPAFAFDYVTGGIKSVPMDIPGSFIQSFVIITKIDNARWLQTTVGRTGRPTICGSTASLGYPTC